MKKAFCFLVVMLPLCNAAFAQEVYKTVNPDGTVTYSDAPTTSSKSLKVFPGTVGANKNATTKGTSAADINPGATTNNALSGGPATSGGVPESKPANTSRSTSASSNKASTSGGGGGSAGSKGGGGSSTASGKTAATTAAPGAKTTTPSPAAAGATTTPATTGNQAATGTTTAPATTGNQAATGTTTTPATTGNQAATGTTTTPATTGNQAATGTTTTPATTGNQAATGTTTTPATTGNQATTGTTTTPTTTGSQAGTGTTTSPVATGDQASNDNTILIKGEGYPPLSCQNKAIWSRWEAAGYKGANVLPGIAKKDWQVLVNNWHVNVVRLQIVLTDTNLRLVANGGLDALPNIKAQIQDFMKASLENNVDVVLDLHRVEGGAGDSGLLWGSPQLKQNYRKVLIAFAKEMQNYPNVAGIDILNEPTPKSVYTKLWSQRKGTADDWLVLAQLAIDDIRKFDACMPIIVEPVDWAKSFRMSEVEPFDDPYIVYSPHMYAPFEVTHQGINQFVKGTTLAQYNLGTASQLNTYARNVMNEARKFQCKYDKPIYIGEFGINFYAKEADRNLYVNTLTSIFEEYGWSWSYHAYQIWEGWNPSAVSLTKLSQPKLLKAANKGQACN